MAFFFPQAHAGIDWSRGYELLDKELRRLYEQGYGRQEVINLFRFIDWVMQLPEELEEGFWQEIRTYEEAKQMPYITSVERIGIQKGIEQGLQQGTRQGLLKGIEVGLELKFGSEGLRILLEIYQIEDVDRLSAVCEGLKVVQSLEELQRIYQ